jgi:5-methyltetrahydropteroyltriglutamate--homocysteine methyltransferase
VIGDLRAPRGLGTVADFERLERVASRSLASHSPAPALKASVPGPYTLSGRLLANRQYPDRFALAEALLPIVRAELQALVQAGCQEITVDEPSMSCYAHRDDPRKFVDLFNRTVEPVVGRCRLSTHLCFGNYKARAVGPRRYAPMFPAFLELAVDEIHLEMASREGAELELLRIISAQKDVAVGVVDVKSSYLESPGDIADRVRAALRYAPPERLAFAPDCGLSQTARWAAREKLKHLVQGVLQVRRSLGLGVPRT